MKVIPVNKKKSSLMSEDDIKTLALKSFDKYDTSGDGCLDKEELTQFFEDILKRRRENGKKDTYSAEEMAENFINLVDLNGDEKLTREEIYEFYKQ